MGIPILSSIANGTVASDIVEILNGEKTLDEKQKNRWDNGFNATVNLASILLPYTKVFKGARTLRLLLEANASRGGSGLLGTLGKSIDTKFNHETPWAEDLGRLIGGFAGGAAGSAGNTHLGEETLGQWARTKAGRRTFAGLGALGVAHGSISAVNGETKYEQWKGIVEALLGFMSLAPAIEAGKSHRVSGKDMFESSTKKDIETILNSDRLNENGAEGFKRFKTGSKSDTKMYSPKEFLTKKITNVIEREQKNLLGSYSDRENKFTLSKTGKNLVKKGYRQEQIEEIWKDLENTKNLFNKYINHPEQVSVEEKNFIDEEIRILLEKTPMRINPRTQVFEVKEAGEWVQVENSGLQADHHGISVANMKDEENIEKIIQSYISTKNVDVSNIRLMPPHTNINLGSRGTEEWINYAIDDALTYPRSTATNWWKRMQFDYPYYFNISDAANYAPGSDDWHENNKDPRYKDGGILKRIK